MAFSTFINDYSYQPLEQGSIRLLNIEPGAQAESIKCHLTHSSLFEFSQGEGREYEALSYVWGDQSDPPTISIGGSAVKVTKNLEAALRAVRRQDEPRAVWADAICINQQDIPERNDQVSRMADIYKRACRVLVWLGPAGEMSDEVIDFISGQLEWVRPMWRKYGKSGFTIDDLQGVSTRFQQCAYPALWKSLAVLCSREYWGRLWIVQEVVLAEGLDVMCGSKTIPWDTLDSFVGLVRAVSAHLPGGMSSLNSDLRQLEGALDFTRIAEHRRPRPHAPPMSLAQYMARHRDSKCSDSRDLVYSMLGLANASDFPVIDYALSVKEVYAVAFKYCVEKSRSLNVICNHQFRMGVDGPAHVEGLPSWLPDWRSLWFAGTIISAGGQKDKQFNASAGRQPVIEYLNNDHTLSVQGFVLDRIGYTDPPITILRDSMSNQDFEYVAARIMRWYKLANSTEVMAIRPFDGTAFWRTLVVDAHRINSLRSLPERAAIEVDMAAGKIIFYGNNLFKGVMVDHLRLCQYLRKFSITAKGMYCMSSICTEPGDLVCILFGSDTPVILREVGEHLLFIGDSYVDGMMRGEAVERLDKGEYELRNFEIW
jgi:Heterokaryon incompatibility protein (HET)